MSTAKTFPVSYQLLSDPNLGYAAKLLYSALWFESFQGKRFIRHDQESIGKMLGVSERQARRLLDEIEEFGLIKSQRRGKRISNEYEIKAYQGNSSASGDGTLLSAHRDIGDGTLLSSDDGTLLSAPVQEEQIQEQLLKSKDEDKGKNLTASPLKNLGERPTAKTTAKSETSEEIVSKESYIEEMSKEFARVSPMFWQDILSVDLEANSKRKNWYGQLEYWVNRIDETKDCSIWNLVGLYLHEYHSKHRSYPNWRDFLKDWMSDSWTEELKKIGSFCDSKDATVEVVKFLKAKAESGYPIPARKLMSAGEYIRWYVAD